MWILILFFLGISLYLIHFVYEKITGYFHKGYAKKILKKYEDYNEILLSYLSTSNTINYKTKSHDSKNESFTLEYLSTLTYTELKYILTIRSEDLDNWRTKLMKLFERNKRYPLAIFPISRNELVVYRSDAHNWHVGPTIFDDTTLSFWPKHIIEKLLATDESTFELSQSLNSFYVDLDYTIDICSFHSKCIQDLYYKDKTVFPNHELAKLQANPFEKFQAHFKKDVFEYAYQTIRRGHGCFYHFTDRSNLKSIIENGGLYSWYALNEKGIESKMGGNSLSHDLDSRKGLQDYVRLSITTNHPMMHRLEKGGYDLVILKIHPIVTMLEGTLFSNINATDSNCNIGGDVINLISLVKHAGWTLQLRGSHLRGSYSNNLSKNSIYFKLNQGEVLIPHFLPLRYIMNIYDLVGYNDELSNHYKYDFYPQIAAKIYPKWVIKEIRSFSLDELKYIENAKIVSGKHGHSIAFLLKNDITRYLPVLYSNNNLNDGDRINIGNCTVVVLNCQEQKDIVNVIIH